MRLKSTCTAPTLDADGDGGVDDGLELCVCSALVVPGDLTSDSVVSVADLLLLLGLFGATC